MGSLLSEPAFADAAEELWSAYQRGKVLMADDRLEEAAQHFQKAVRLAPEVYGAGDHGPVHLNTARLKHFLANCYLRLFRLTEAEELYQECLDVAKTEQAAESPMAFHIRHNLGLVYRRLYQWNRAEEYYRQRLENDPDPKGRATTAIDLGYMSMELDRHEAAAKLFRKALSIWQDVEGAQLERSHCLHGLGMVARKQGDLEKAQDFLRRALELRQKTLDPGHRYIAHSKGMLAAVHASRGRNDLAKSLLREAEQAMRQYWGAERHIEVAMEQHELGLLLAREGAIGEAVRIFHEARRTYHGYAQRVLTALPRRQQLRFLREERARLQSALAVPLSRPGNGELAEAALEWVLNEKGMSREILAERQLLTRHVASRPQLAPVVEELMQVRRQLSALVVAGRQDSEDARWKQLQAQREGLVRQLGRQLPQTISDSKLWAEVDDIQAKLPETTALVEVFRLTRRRPPVSAFDVKEADPEDDRYVAWTVRGGENGVRLHDLGSAKAIDDSVRRLRRWLRTGGHNASTLTALSRATRGGDLRLGREKRATSMDRLESALRKLSEQILWPLLPSLKGTRRWIVSPDAGLWLVPWSALRLPDDRYLIERVVLTHMVSGRDLLRAIETDDPGTEAVIIADPDFTVRPDGKQARQVQGEQTQFATRGFRSRLAVPKDWRRLPGTRREAEAIRPLLRDYTGRRVKCLLGGHAREQVVKQLASPPIVLLSTHGYFHLPRQKTDINPLLSCGLIFAGANSRAAEASRGNDGVLTGMEVLEADLRGTEIVVLSACETGVGQVAAGEGVASLRQAFHLAGATTVLSTLWQVPDETTAGLMIQFWQQMNQDRNPARALRQAQLQTIRKLREESSQHRAHPWRWAAPVVTQQGLQQAAEAGLGNRTR